MNKIIKGILYGLGAAGLLCIAYFAGAQMQRSNQESFSGQVQEATVIAVVNMDEGVSVDDVQMNYASQLIDLSADAFVSTGLNDAKSGIENGTYAAYIVIPGYFSQYVKAIEKNPKKITLQYAFNPNMDKKLEIQAVNAVNNFVITLNSNIVYMYIDSILAEFHDVQDDSAVILANDNKELEQLQNVDVQQLIVTAEPVEVKEVDADVEPVDLTAYTNKNENLLDNLFTGYSDAVKKGKGEYSDIQSSNAEVGESSDNFFSLYDTVIKDTSANQAKLLETAGNNLGNAIFLYNQNAEEKTQTMAEQISSMVEEQRLADENSANTQMKSIVEKENGKALSSLQEKWETAVGDLKTGAQKNVERLNRDILNKHQSAVNGQLANIIKAAYQQGANDALDTVTKDLKTVYEQNGGIPEDVTDTFSKYTKNKLNENTDDYASKAGGISLSEEKIEIAWDSLGVTLPVYLSDKTENGEGEQTDGENEDIITLVVCEKTNEAAVNQMSQDFTDLFKLEDDKQQINNVIQTDFKDAVLKENQNQMGRLSDAKMDLSRKMSDYEGRLTAYNPLKYLEQANLNTYLDNIGVNTRDMMSAVENNNAEYVQYASNVYSAASEGVSELTNAQDKANQSTVSNVENCMNDLITSRKNVNGENVDMLGGFTDFLQYTRIGGQSNVQVYDYIVSPLISQNVGGDTVDLPAENSQQNDSNINLILIIIISGLVIICLTGILLICHQQYKKRKEKNQNTF